jgi:hypothetical protein
MAEYVGHERLKVYQKGMPFASMCKTLLDDLPRRIASMLRQLSKAVRDDIAVPHFIAHFVVYASSHTLSSTLRRTLCRLFLLGGLSMAPLPPQ